MPARPAEAFAARPLFWAFGAAILGGLAATAPWATPPFWLALVLATAAVAVVGWRRGRLWPAAAVLMAVAACAGISASRAARMPPGDVGELCGRHAIVSGIVASQAERVGLPPDARWRFVLRCDAAETPEGTCPVSGRLSVTLAAPPLVRSSGFRVPGSELKHPGELGTRVPAIAGDPELGTPAPPVAFGERLVMAGIPKAPRGRSNPGGRSLADYLMLRGIWATLSPRPGEWRSLGIAPADRAGLLLELRRRVIAGSRHLAPQAGFLVNSLLLGEQAAPPGIDPEAINTAFRNSGTIHILVVSGTQVMFLLAPILWLCRRSLWLRRAAALLAIPAAIAYAQMAGAEASLMRAVFMGILLALGLSFWREPDLLNMLGFAGLGMLAINPLALRDLGFVLSMAAVWGVAGPGMALHGIASSRIGAWATLPLHSLAVWARPPLWLLRAALVIIAASIGAHLATAPFLARYFQADAPIALTSNVVALPISALLLYAGAGHAVWSFFATPPHWLSALVGFLAEALWRSVSWFAAVPGGHAAVFPLPVLAIVAVFALLALAVRAERRRAQPDDRTAPGAVTVAACAAAALIIFAGERWPAPPPAFPEVTFIDVGQGDATVVRVPGGGTMLIDAGGDPNGLLDTGERMVLPALRALRLPRLDLVVATHPHDDHIGGMPAVVEAAPIGLFLDSGQFAGTATQQRLLAALTGRRVPFRIVQAGDRIELGAARFDVLGPGRPFLAGTRSDLNTNSVVLRLTIGQHHLLLPGDAELPSEARILTSRSDLDAEVLKLGHHGSGYSTSDAWLRAIRPAVAVACCGVENRFGHPSPRTVSKCEAAGIRVYRTDRDGAVSITLEPEVIRVHCELTGAEARVPYAGSGLP